MHFTLLWKLCLLQGFRNRPLRVDTFPICVNSHLLFKRFFISIFNSSPISYKLVIYQFGWFRRKWVLLETKAEDDWKTRKKSKSSKYVHFTKIMEVSYKYTRCNRAFVNEKLHFFPKYNPITRSNFPQLVLILWNFKKLNMILDPYNPDCYRVCLATMQSSFFSHFFIR